MLLLKINFRMEKIYGVFTSGIIRLHTIVICFALLGHRTLYNGRQVISLWLGYVIKQLIMNC